MQKRNQPISPPSMTRAYCCLYGTMLLDYETEEESRMSLVPKNVAEIIGVSIWDGQGRANQYDNAFLVVTHTGGTYYIVSPNTETRDEWITYIRRSLECNFANPRCVRFKPSKVLSITSVQKSP